MLFFDVSSFDKISSGHDIYVYKEDAISEEVVVKMVCEYFKKFEIKNPDIDKFIVQQTKNIEQEPIKNIEVPSTESKSEPNVYLEPNLYLDKGIEMDLKLLAKKNKHAFKRVVCMNAIIKNPHFKI